MWNLECGIDGMDLTFTSVQQALKDAVRRYCQEQITRERLAAWGQAPRGIDEGSWRAIAELGWFGLGVPAAAGGSGLGLVEVARVLQECARGLVPRAVSNAIASAWALARLAPDTPELAAIAAGQETVALALDEAFVRDPSRYQTHARSDKTGVTVSGTKWYVPDGAHADHHLVAARDEAGVSLVMVARAAARAEPLRTIDGEPQAVVHYADAPVRRCLAQGESGRAAWERLRAEQTALSLAEMLGGMEAALDMTVAYVKAREQFGQKIAVFQAVQHQVADMATAFTASRHLAWQAITRLAAGTAEGTELATAAAFVGQACKRVTLTAHHLHGGAGYVVEHPLHYHAERAQSLCIRYAPEAPALAAVAASLLDQ
jgi:hypothetical protein